jgi:hypothetical protein
MQVHTIDDVIARQEAIIAWSHRHQSRLGYFPALYRKMTLQVRDGISTGFFDDGERMQRLGVIFANRYFVAFDQYQHGGPVTASWRLAFEAAQRWGPIVSQHLALGLNAHINLDLGIAMARSVPLQQLPEAQNDFNKINFLLADLVDRVQAELTEIWPFYGLLDWLKGRHDEVCINFSLTRARQHAWSVAERLAALPEAEQERDIVAVDRHVVTIGGLVLHPGFLARTLLTVIRLGERGSIPDIIDILT